jgi:RNA polymerase sporulation-specific sigma factor
MKSPMHCSGDRLDELSDDTLLKWAAKGDMRAEEMLVVRYTPMVYSIARTCYRQGLERADFVQEGMVGLLYAIREFSPEKGSFAAFASVCIRNALYSALRKALSKKQAAMNGYISLSSPEGDKTASSTLLTLLSEDTTADALDRLIREDEQARLLAALTALLSPFEQKVLSAWLAGFSIPETARALDKSVKSVENALTRLRRKAKDLAAGQSGSLHKD